MSKKPIFAYSPIVQKPFCCIPACLKMILERRNISYGSQEEIGNKLGLIVPKKVRHHFKNVNTTSSIPVLKCGTRVIFSKKPLINNFFEEEKIPLKEEYFKLKNIPDVKHFISENLMRRNDIIVFFHEKKLYGKGVAWGHASLIEAIENSTITLVDPKEGVPKRRQVSLIDLSKSIDYYGEKNRAGFWLILDN